MPDGRQKKDQAEAEWHFRGRPPPPGPHHTRYLNIHRLDELGEVRRDLFELRPPILPAGRGERGSLTRIHLFVDLGL